MLLVVSRFALESLQAGHEDVTSFYVAFLHHPAISASEPRDSVSMSWPTAIVGHIFP